MDKRVEEKLQFDREQAARAAGQMDWEEGEIYEDLSLTDWMAITVAIFGTLFVIGLALAYSFGWVD